MNPLCVYILIDLVVLLFFLVYNLNNITTPKRLEQLCIRIIEKILLYNKIGYID